MRRAGGLVLAMMACQGHAVDLSLLVGYTISGTFENVDSKNEVQVDETPSYAVAVDFPYKGKPDQRLGVYLSQQNTDFSDDAELDDSDVSITHLQFTAMTLWPHLRWEPFLLLGVGAVHYSPADNSLKDLTRVSAQIAGGTNYKVSENLLLRAGARWIPTFFDSSAAAFCDGGCSLGVSGTVWSQVVIDAGIQLRF